MLTPRKVRGADVLERFWITVEEDGKLPPGSLSRLGYGVTAFDLDDALGLLRDHVFGGQVPTIESAVEGVDMSSLDEGHIRPNMETPAFRGVWFPRGFALILNQTTASFLWSEETPWNRTEEDWQQDEQAGVRRWGMRNDRRQGRWSSRDHRRQDRPPS